MPKVFITNLNASYSYDAADEFGDTVFMTQGIQREQKFNELSQIFERYAETSTDEDYLLLSGTNIVCAIAVAAWLKVKGSVTLLQHTNYRPHGKDKPVYIQHRIET